MSSADVQDLDERQRLKNKKRLQHQNVKLNQEIRKLQSEMSELIQTRQSQMIENYEKVNNDLGKKREEITMQEKYIKKLKSKIDFLKSANVKGNAEFIIREEDALRIVKKEYQRLIVQKQTVIRFQKDKEKKLQVNLPFKQHKESIESSLAEVKKNNRLMQAEIVELQRQVRKYHNYIVLNTNISRQKLQANSIQYQIAETDHQVKQIQIKIKEVQQKWRPQMQALDKELFQLRSSFEKCQKKLEQVEKQHQKWEIRSSGLRGQQQVSEFRERLSKVHLLPEDKQFAQQMAKKTVPTRIWRSKEQSLQKSNIKNEEQSQKIQEQPVKENIMIEQKKQIQQKSNKPRPQPPRGSINKKKTPENQQTKRVQKQTSMAEEVQQKQEISNKQKNKGGKNTKGSDSKKPNDNKKQQTPPKQQKQKDKVGPGLISNKKKVQNKGKMSKEDTKSEKGLQKSMEKKKQELQKQKSQKKVSINETKNIKTPVKQQNSKSISKVGKQQKAMPDNSNKKKQKQTNKKQPKLLLKSVGVGP